MALVDGVTCDDAALAWGGCAAAVVRPRRMMRTAEWRMTRRRAFSRECAAFFGAGRNRCGYSSGAGQLNKLGIMYAFLTPWLHKKWSTTKAQNSVSRNQPFSSHSFLLAAILSSSILSRSTGVGTITRDVAAQGDRDKEGDDCVT